MCGIVGVVNRFDPRPIGEALLAGMIATVCHRGPEQSGLYLDEWCALGHSRLNIIDLAGGGQPIHNEDQTIWISYNGEVFNYPELRRELEAQGHRFYTQTDTEVIVHLYEERGPACLRALNGQFALAIWDASRHELLLARDRLGICPLHYALFDGRLLFASELKAILSYPGFPRQLDPAALNQIFTYWTAHPGNSAFLGVKELPPGHFLKLERGEIQLQPYWEIPEAGRDQALDWPEEAICERVLELLTDAVRIRLRADVPVGCYLSGGLDSSLLAATVVRNFDGGVRTFGIRFQDPRFDEGAYQERMVAHLGVNHQALWADHEAIGENLPQALWHIEKPLLRTAPVPLYLLSGAVRQAGYKVVLTGEGADEIFGGYNIFREAKARRFWSRQPASALRPLLIGRLYPYIFTDARLRQMLTAFFGQNLLDVDDPFYSHAIRWRNTGRLRGYFRPEVREEHAPAADLEALHRMLPAGFGRLDPLAKAQYLEMMLFLSGYLLCSQGDRVAMAHAVELRVPFLDHRLVEFASRIPSRLKIRGMCEKYILRRTARELVPAEITARNKHPYRAPIRDSLMGKRSWERLGEYVAPAALREAGIFDPPRVERLLQKMRGAPDPGEVDNMALIGIVSTQILHQQFVSSFPDRLAAAAAAPDSVFDRRPGGRAAECAEGAAGHAGG